MIFDSLEELRNTSAETIIRFFKKASFTGYFTFEIKSKYPDEYCGSFVNIMYNGENASFMPHYINVLKGRKLSKGYYKIKFDVDIDKLKIGSMNIFTIRYIEKLQSTTNVQNVEKKIPSKHIFISKEENVRRLTKVVVEVRNIVIKNADYYYEVEYEGKKNYVRLLPFEVNMLDRAKSKKYLSCVISEHTENGELNLVQDRDTLIDELYEENTKGTFTVVGIKYDYKDNTNNKYYIVKDSYGLTHRLNIGKEEREYNKGEKLELYIKGISNSKHLVLALYNPNLEEASRTFFDADKVFSEIEETESKSQYFDCYFIPDVKVKYILEKDLIGQYNGKSNLWLFTFMNILDTIIIPNLIKERLIEELIIVSNIMIKLQKWMVEGSCFLDLFTEDKKNETIQKSASQIDKFTFFLKATDIIKEHKQDKYIKDIINAIQKSGRIAINKEERLSILKNLLLLNPEYLTQDISVTCDLMKLLLTLGEEIDSHYIMSMVARLNYCVEYDARKIRATSFRSNYIDTSQTVIINEILSLLCIETLLQSSGKYNDELKARSTKARFFRILSLICNEDSHASILEAGFNAAVGILNDTGIFTWDNAEKMDTISICKLTLQATVVDRNINNDYYYIKPGNKSGLVILDATGFTIVPHKQCVHNLKISLHQIAKTRILHSMDSIPLKLGSMYNYKELNLTNDAIGQYENWKNVTHRPQNLVLQRTSKIPIEGDKVLVMAKEQLQAENLKNLLFVTVVDSDYELVDGVIDVKNISSRWIEDTRNLFTPGDVFYAKTCKSPIGKHIFSIKEYVDQNASESLKDSLKRIVLNKEDLDEQCCLPKELLQEIVLLIDLRIKAEKDASLRLTLIGYAYCLSAMLSDTKSYYYDFLLKYYASIEKFVNNDQRDINIDFHRNVLDSRFPNLKNKRNLVEMLSYANCYNPNDIETLKKLADEEPLNDIGKLSALLLACIYIQRVGLSGDVAKNIRNEIKEFIVHTKDIDLSAWNITEEYVNGTSFIKEKYSTDDHDIINEIEPLAIDIYDDETMIISKEKDSVCKGKGIVTIHIPACSINGILLLFNNDKSLAKVGLRDVLKMQIDESNTSTINPYKLHSYFVVPTECLFGFLTNSKNGEYIEVYDSSNFHPCTLSEISYIKLNDFNYDKIQSFILPKNIVDSNIIELVGQRINTDNLSSNIVEELNTFGVLIKNNYYDII